MEKFSRSSSGVGNHQQQQVQIIRASSIQIADLSQTNVYEICKIKKDLENLIEPENFAVYTQVMNQ